VGGLLSPPPADLVERQGLDGPRKQAACGNKSFDAVLDWLERVLVLSLYACLVFRIVSSYIVHGSFVDLLLLPSEGLVVFFLLIRRSAATISRHAGDWLAALAATCAALLVSPVPERALVPVQLAAVFIFAGMFIQILAKVALGRSIGCVPANRGLQLGGAYRFVRHPMYAGYFLSEVAFLAVNPTRANAAIYLVCWGLQLYRLTAEERFLSRDARYCHYRSMVRYRLIPGLF
jgi:protein-S-isoprenylcysteine O-methyltransferase Ste14